MTDPSAFANLAGGMGSTGAGAAAGKGSSAFSMLGGGMMGLGQGLMPTKMRSSYNAGQQGLQDLVRAQQAGDYMKGRVGSATLEDLERELGAIRAKMGKARVSMPQGGQ